jgi:hypothetical protein
MSKSKHLMNLPVIKEVLEYNFASCFKKINELAPKTEKGRTH